jgi:DUF1365 family protein
LIFGVDASIFHARHRPRRNAFHYRALYLAVPIEELREGHPSSLFSIDRPNLFGLRAADYGSPSSPPAAWIGGVLKNWNIREADGSTILVTMPRVFGYVFNPVSFWLCFDAEGGLRAVLAEVNNTFGERHSYLCCHDDHRVIVPQDTLRTHKAFHVSPFIAVKGEYRFRFSYTRDRIAIAIDLFDDEGLLLSTTIGGPARPLSSWRLLRALLGNPLLPIKVIGLIHYQALKLYLKKIDRFQKPLPPAMPISD